MDEIESVKRIEIVDWRDGAEVVKKFTLPEQEDVFSVEVEFFEGGTMKIFMKDQD